MTFFSRPNLDNVQFRQDSGTTLDLSGLTKISNISGLTLSNGDGSDVLITASGASSSKVGHVLGYDGSVIKLMPSSASGDTVYLGTSPTTTRVGGLDANTDIYGCSITSILEDILVPSVSPSSSISLTDNSTKRQFGDTDTEGNICWNVTKQTNNISDISLSTDGTGAYNCVILSNGSLSSSTGATESYTFDTNCANPPMGTNSTSVMYSVCAVSVSGESTTSNVNIKWMNKRFYFGDNTLYTDDSIGSTLRNKQGNLSTSKSLNINVTLDNEFFYYSYPKSFGTPSFTVNGLQNNAWGNPSTGTLYEFVYSNSNGYSNNYYVARSDNRITGNFSIVVS